MAEQTEPAGPPLLVAEGICVRFGGVTAVEHVSISVDHAEILGVIGPNGAGKTTLLNVVNGFVSPAEGRVTMNATDVTSLSPQARSRLGMGRTFQTPRLFAGLTVEENLDVAGRQHRHRPGLGLSAPEILDLVDIAPLADRPVERLDAGEQRFVEIARSLMTGPRLLLLDEPATGLRDVEVDRLQVLLRALASDHGVATLVVDHDMRLVLTVCDRVAVLDYGVLLTCAGPDEVRRDARVVEAYFGEGVLAS